MLEFLGWGLILFPGILFFGQIISSVNFGLAQKLGIQENPNETDTLPQRAEKYAAYWDVIVLGWMPLSGVLMVMNHHSWPLLSFFSAAIYFDTAGREAAKYLCFKHEGLRLGTARQQSFFFATYFIMGAIALFVMMVSLSQLLSSP